MFVILITSVQAIEGPHQQSNDLRALPSAYCLVLLRVLYLVIVSGDRMFSVQVLSQGWICCYLPPPEVTIHISFMHPV